MILVHNCISVFFYELELQLKGMKSVLDCLLEYGREETLSGGNQYMCEHCNAKQDAERSVKVKELPLVLNLQLMRFAFDFKTMAKRKPVDPDTSEALDQSERRIPEPRRFSTNEIAVSGLASSLLVGPTGKASCG